MIDICQVTKRYGAALAVNSVSLRMAAGQTMVLIGPSGSGKTTLLKMINRMVAFDTGSIRVNGEDIAAADPVALRRSIGYVIQQIGLLPHFSVNDNISFVLRLIGQPKPLRDERAEALVRMVGLPPEVLAKRPFQLSGGQQQRVGVARALAADPAIILMDEPFGAVDPITRRKLQDMILALQERMRKTIVFVTHDMQEALTLGHRVAVLDRGELVSEDTAAATAESDNPFVRELIGATGRCAR
jgi:osmoprotectant transport system ATP-binding protein